MKKRLAIVIAAAMLTLVGCGNTNDGSSSVADIPTSAEATTAAEGATATAGEVKTTETENTAAETTTTTEVQDNKYAYYKDLAAEFEACGLSSGELLKLNPRLTGANNSADVYYRKGKMYFLYSGSDDTKERSLVSYDIKSGETTQRALEGVNGTVYFSGGKFYYDGNNGEQICIGDVDDEGYSVAVSAAELSAEESGNSYKARKYALLPSGALIEKRLYDQSGDGMFSYYSEETGEVMLPLPTITDEHGLEQKTDADFMAAYGNKAYYCIKYYGQGNKNFIYCLDLEKKEWEKKPTFFEASNGYGVGKYLFMRSNKERDYIYNMETFEMVAIIAEYKPYYGGEQHVFMYKGHSDVPYVTEYKFPSDGSQPEKKEYNNVIPITPNYHYPVTGKYFLFADNAGIFLRTYDNSEPEAIIMVFEH